MHLIEKKGRGNWFNFKFYNKHTSCNIENKLKTYVKFVTVFCIVGGWDYAHMNSVLYLPSIHVLKYAYPWSWSCRKRFIITCKTLYILVCAGGQYL